MISDANFLKNVRYIFIEINPINFVAFKLRDDAFSLWFFLFFLLDFSFFPLSPFFSGLFKNFISLQRCVFLLSAF